MIQIHQQQQLLLIQMEKEQVMIQHLQYVISKYKRYYYTKYNYIVIL